MECEECKYYDFKRDMCNYETDENEVQPCEYLGIKELKRDTDNKCESCHWDFDSDSDECIECNKRSNTFPTNSNNDINMYGINKQNKKDDK